MVNPEVTLLVAQCRQLLAQADEALARYDDPDDESWDAGSLVASWVALKELAGDVRLVQSSAERFAADALEDIEVVVEGRVFRRGARASRKWTAEAKERLTDLMRGRVARDCALNGRDDTKPPKLGRAVAS